MKLEEAEKLAMETDYACFAVGEEINAADAGAFFLEGYNHAKENIFKCDKCDGTGFIDGQTSGVQYMSFTGIPKVLCRNCNGKGTLL